MSRLRPGGRASLVIPAFDERGRVESAIAGIAAWRRTRPGEFDWEVIVVDDGSTDDTGGLARRAAQAAGLPIEIVRHERNRGKGAAIRTGVLASSGDPVLVSDTDLSTPLTEWVKLAERLPTHPIAIGSRAVDEALVRKRQPFYRQFMGKSFNTFVRLLAVPGIRDTQCGFKLFRGDVARDLFSRARIDRFAYDVEILYLARQRGIPIAEVPVLWFNSPESKVAVVRDSLRMLRDLLRIRWIHRDRKTGDGRR
ncbi:MAG TPA: dolichyl-phosphate beta-glucosyltransferase [Thermoanaerobaculia bacterium]|nr:dolichyl-phosphate beta-glucosyltransferase [Thermoanaerobaculia bacterium]